MPVAGPGIISEKLVCAMNQKLVGIGDLQVVILLIAHDHQTATGGNECTQGLDILRGKMVWIWVSADSLLARIGNDYHADPLQVFL